MSGEATYVALRGMVTSTSKTDGVVTEAWATVSSWPPMRLGGDISRLKIGSEVEVRLPLAPSPGVSQ